jgi:hypothetical protein
MVGCNLITNTALDIVIGIEKEGIARELVNRIQNIRKDWI